MTDRRELVYDPEELYRTVIESLLTRVWTAMPCKILAFYPSDMTVDCQPSFNGQFTAPDGSTIELQMPVLPKVPVQFPGGGGCSLTFNPVAGDECLVVFASRCIDAWWTQGFMDPNKSNALGLPFNPSNTPPEIRRHNLSDGIALLGVRNKTRSYVPVTGGAQLQSDDGQAYVQLNLSNHAVNIVAPGGVNINGAVISAAGEITDALGKVLGTHTHGGVTTGSGTTGAPS